MTVGWQGKNVITVGSKGPMNEPATRDWSLWRGHCVTWSRRVSHSAGRVSTVFHRYQAMIGAPMHIVITKATACVGVDEFKRRAFGSWQRKAETNSSKERSSRSQSALVGFARIQNAAP